MNTTSAPARRHLRAHQARSRDRILGQLEHTDRALLVSACGTGKTITLHSLIDGRGARRVAAFFPSLALVDQTVEEWGMQFGGRMRAIVVCSDDTVGQRFKAAGKDDEFTVSDEDLEAAGAEVVRDVDELSLILQTHDTDALPLVVFSTYQSSEKVAEAQTNTGVRFDLLIADEAHKLATGNQQKVSARSGKLVLDADAILADKRVFATATPKTFTYSATSENHRGAEASMDDEALFGAVADTVGLRDAINQNLLTDYRIHIMGVSPDAARSATQLDLGEIDGDDANVRMALGIAALQRAQVELGVTRVIAYLSSRARANSFARIVRDMGVAECSVITGDQPASERKPKLEALAGNGGVIANVRCLTEGVDVPSLDAVLFVDPRTSKVDIVQAVGRAIRLAPGKELGHVILPVLHDPGTPEDGWLEGNGYRGVWDVLAQMAENDTALQSFLRARSERDGSNPSDGNDPSDGIDEATGSRIIETHIDSEISKSSLSERFYARFALRAAALSDPLGATWRDNANRLATFRAVHDRWPSQKEPSESSLGYWLRDQRKAARHGRRYFSDARRAHLDRVVPGWQVSRDDEWLEYAREVVAFASHTGRTPSKTAKDPAERALGIWISRQRTHANLSDERAAFLDEHLPGWRRDPEREWRAQADAVAAHKTTHGTWPSTGKRADPSERRLGVWLSQARGELKTGMLARNRQEHLDNMAPGWDRDRWQDTADHLVAFVHEHKRLPIYGRGGAEGRLSSWLGTQRRNRALAPARKRFLDANVPAWAPSRGDDWHSKVDALAAFVKGVGRLPAEKSNDEDESRLARWVSNQRFARRTAVPSFTVERLAALDAAAPGWYHDKETLWASRVEELALFLAAHGRFPSGSKSADDTERLLGVWLANQRKSARRNESWMTAERRARIESLVPGWV